MYVGKLRPSPRLEWVSWQGQIQAIAWEVPGFQPATRNQLTRQRRDPGKLKVNLLTVSAGRKLGGEGWSPLSAEEESGEGGAHLRRGTGQDVLL